MQFNPIVITLLERHLSYQTIAFCMDVEVKTIRQIGYGQREPDIDLAGKLLWLWKAVVEPVVDERGHDEFEAWFKTHDRVRDLPPVSMLMHCGQFERAAAAAEAFALGVV